MERQAPLPCCGYRPYGDGPESHPVHYNQWNAVVQCHACGEIWLPGNHKHIAPLYSINSIGRKCRKTNFKHE